MLHILSQQLGPLDIPEESAVAFPHGLPAFPAARHFCLLELRPGSRFKLLQCIDEPNLAFVVTDPLLIDPSYPLASAHAIGAQLGLQPEEPIAAAVIVTVPPPPAHMTANLLAPVLMGVSSRRGVQVVLHSSSYQVRHEL